MNELKMKAKAGVTLVELLVVILIVTILSVSLLPLLKPYIEQAKYAAEPIPVLANIQTKINLYQYEKDKLPGVLPMNNADPDIVETWKSVATNDNGGVSFPHAEQRMNDTTISDWAATNVHFAAKSRIDVDWQDLVGRQMNPTHFKYVCLKGDGVAKYGYVLGVFGDGDGLGVGTGYAVMTLVDTANNLKIVATWERYKPVDDVQVYFDMESDPSDSSVFCWLPSPAAIWGNNATISGLVTDLEKAGWKFNESAVK